MAYGGSRRQHLPELHTPDDFGIGRLFARVRDAVIVLEAASGTIVLWNPSAEAIFGFSAAEAAGMSVEAIGLSPVLPPDIDGSMGSVGPVRLAARTRGGHECTIEVTLSPIEDAPVAGRFLMAIVRDVTETVRAEAALRQAEATYRGMFEHAVEGIFQIAPDGRLLNANPALAHILGFDTPRALIDAFTGGHYQGYLDPARRDEFFRLLRADGRITEFESQVYRQDGSVIWISQSGRAVQGPDGELRYFEGSVQDVTPRRRAAAEQAARAIAEAEQQRLSFLAEASAALASSLDYAATLRQVARLAVPFLADGCSVDMLAEDGSIERLAVACVDPERERLARELQARFPVRPDAPSGVGFVVRSGQAQVLNGPEVSDAHQAAARDDEHLALLRRLQTTARMIVPLIARGRTLGAISFNSTDPERRYSAADLALAEEIGRRASLAIDHARLYETLAQSEQRFRSLVQKASDVVALLGPDARVRYVSPPVERVLGFRPEELLGQSPGALVHPEDRATVQAAVHAALTQPVTFHTSEFRLRHADGSWRTLEVTANNLLADPAVRGIVVNLHDITERKRAEQEQRFLAETGALLAASLDYDATLSQLMALAVPTLGDWSVLDTVEADGSIRRLAVSCPDPMIARALDALARYFPIDPAGVHPIATVLRTGEPVFTPDMTGFLQGLAEDEEHRALLRTIRTRSRMTVPLIAHGRRLGAISFGFATGGLEVAVEGATDERRHDAGDLALAQDFAERAALALDNARLYHEAQAALDQTRIALEMRDEFLSVASHELRTPLTALKGQVQLAERWLRRGNLGPLTGLIGQADQQVDRLSGLIRDLLDVSRMRAGGIALERDAVALGALVQRVVELERAAARGRVIDLVMPDDVPAVAADRERIEQILINLVQNARKYSPPTKPITVRVLVERNSVAVAVEDQGVGIPPEELPRIFDRFHRAANVDRNITGLGLGLYIAHQIVEAHGGELRVRSALGEGSTFTLVLPRDGEAVNPSPDPSPP